jgi:4,5:9,10-diseco-3-hydroxy-5,9,17-trioxoandrosta-1(10),2-diene-4-oate hydrolase
MSESDNSDLTFASTSRFVETSAGRIHYHEAGTGPVLLCIHGGAPGAFGWGNFGYNLADWSESFRVLIVDLPGYGLSDKPDITGGRYTFYARAFVDMLAALNIDKAHVLGMATGGAAAIKMAIDAPERIDDLILVSSAGGMPMFTLSPSEGQKTIASYYGGEGPSRERMKAYMDMMVFDPDCITDDIVDERYEASVQPEFMAKAPEGHGRTTVNEPVWKDLDKIQARTLIVWGRENRVQGYDNALYMLSRIPDSQVHIFGRTGLWVPFERKKEFSAVLRAFLDNE